MPWKAASGIPRNLVSEKAYRGFLENKKALKTLILSAFKIFFLILFEFKNVPSKGLERR
jgi:hypothetical protein